MKPKIHIICGPTAVGKTDQALAWAQQHDAEIISADSGQIYRGLNIGTAKPTLEERQGVPVHLMDIIDPNERFSAAQFVERAAVCIEEIQARGKKVVVCGGTGLYIRALLGGLFAGPSADEALRQQLELRAASEGWPALHAALQQVDPVAAAAIPENNRYRLIRALEVYHLTGRPISAFWQEHQFQEQPYDDEYQWMELPRDQLYRRIEARVDGMIARGLIDEVKDLLKQWGAEAPGLQIIGYKEMVAYLKGDIHLDEAIRLIKQHTRNYAKRQLTWFKKYLIKERKG